MLDTSPQARKFYFEKLAKLSPAQRMEAMARMSRLARQMAEAGLRREHPNVAPMELKLQLAVRLYGREVAQWAYGSGREDS